MITNANNRVAIMNTNITTCCVLYHVCNLKCSRLGGCNYDEYLITRPPVHEMGCVLIMYSSDVHNIGMLVYL